MHRLTRTERNALGREWLTLDELHELIPPYAFRDNVRAQSTTAHYLIQVHWKGRDGAIRRIRRHNGDQEVLIDFGFYDMRWIGPNDPAPIVDEVTHNE